MFLNKTQVDNRAYIDLLYGSLILACLTILSIIIFRSALIAQAAAANYIVISEIQVAGSSADDEFIELYNPTGSEVDLSGWRLTRKTAAGTESNLVASLSGTIPAYGYYLITPPTGYDGATSADETYSATTNAITSNNTVLLYSDSGVTLVDKVGMGTAADTDGTAALSPDADMSIERKATAGSTEDTMALGGSEEEMGNSEDSTDNYADFLVRVTPQPQNATSSTEQLVSSTETPTPTVEPTETPTPTDEPTSTPTPTGEPTPTEEPTLTPTPTEEPSVTPTVEVTPTETPTPTVEPSETPSPSPTSTPEPDEDDDKDENSPYYTFRVGRKVCTLSYKKLVRGRGRFIYLVPQIECETSPTSFPWTFHWKRK